MKKLLVLLILVAPFISNGQSYTFKRCFSQVPGAGSNFLKLQGSIVVTDSLIKMTTNGVEAIMPVVTLSKGNGSQQFKMKVNEDMDVRLTLGPNPSPSKNEDYVFIIETKDKFINNNTRTMYYLSKVN